jgi:hypothetical protein
MCAMSYVERCRAYKLVYVKSAGVDFIQVFLTEYKMFCKLGFFTI